MSLPGSEIITLRHSGCYSAGDRTQGLTLGFATELCSHCFLAESILWALKKKGRWGLKRNSATVSCGLAVPCLGEITLQINKETPEDPMLGAHFHAA